MSSVEKSRLEACMNPKLTDPNYIVLSKRLEFFRSWIEKIPGNHLRILDVGGRVQPYRPLFSGRISEYITVDPQLTSSLDVVGIGESLPFQSESFDVVICTQVMEYVSNPFEVAGELHRVLKTDGFLLFSAPSSWPVDNVLDRWRFLPAGLEELFSDYRLLEIRSEGGTIGGFFRSLNIYFNIFSRKGLARWVVRHTSTPLFNIMGLIAGKLSSNSSFSVNYSLCARK